VSDLMPGMPQGDPTQETGDTKLTQSSQNKPAGERPVGMRETYSVMSTGEVVSVGVVRLGKGRGAQLETWIWNDDGRRWMLAEEEYGGEVATDLAAGVNRYEQIRTRDPKRAAALRHRADNKVDSKNTEMPEMPADLTAPGEPEQPEIAERDAPPGRPGNILTSDEQPEVAE